MTAGSRVMHSSDWASQAPQIIIVMSRFDPSLVFICTIIWILQQLEISWTIMEEPKCVFPLKAPQLFNVLKNPSQEIFAQWLDDRLHIPGFYHPHPTTPTKLYPTYTCRHVHSLILTTSFHYLHNVCQIFNKGRKEKPMTKQICLPQ